ncbi:MAG: putative polynucleotide kinase [Prokaryotic dsDNA virus sp.]|nr:MAG: putative polynucleotide kinase [Prokaryotic dsDNA virus sp.]|tara:strand:+ start:1794 stop:2276 length:483 start_codon:yes stop_codon:yes gene_type:complete
MKRAIICDVDGTVSLMDFKKRTPYEYIKANEDKPNQPVIDLVLNTAKAFECYIVFVSARENVSFSSKRSEHNNAYDLTKWWIHRHVFDRMAAPTGIPGWELLLRDYGDHRKDSFCKYDIYKKEIAHRYDVKYVFDDRNQVVDMWRNALGLQCMQVADGNF